MEAALGASWTDTRVPVRSHRVLARLGPCSDSEILAAVLIERHPVAAIK
jgi:hypothetical protein